MKKIANNQVSRKRVSEVVQLGLPEFMRRELREMMFDEGMRVLYEHLEHERAAVCGPRYAEGRKHVLGKREDATETSTSCTAMLSDMQNRGLRTERPILVVLDGSKALAKAVRAVFGARVKFQRCQAHAEGRARASIADASGSIAAGQHCRHAGSGHRS